MLREILQNIAADISTALRIRKFRVILGAISSLMIALIAIMMVVSIRDKGVRPSTRPSTRPEIKFVVPAEVSWDYQDAIIIYGIELTNEHEVWVEDTKLEHGEVGTHRGMTAIPAYVDANEIGQGKHDVILKHNGEEIDKLEGALKVLKKEQEKEKIGKFGLLLIFLVPLVIISFVIWCISRLLGDEEESEEEVAGETEGQDQENNS